VGVAVICKNLSNNITTHNNVFFSMHKKSLHANHIIRVCVENFVDSLQLLLLCAMRCVTVVSSYDVMMM